MISTLCSRSSFSWSFSISVSLALQCIKPTVSSYACTETEASSYFECTTWSNTFLSVIPSPQMLVRSPWSLPKASTSPKPSQLAYWSASSVFPSWSSSPRNQRLTSMFSPVSSLYYAQAWCYSSSYPRSSPIEARTRTSLNLPSEARLLPRGKDHWIRRRQMHQFLLALVIPLPSLEWR